MATLHHATVKRAARLGVEIAVLPGDPELYRAIRLDDKALSAVFESAPKLLDAVDADTAEFQDAPSRKGSRSGVMVMIYHVRYTQNGGGCGDTLDQALRDLLVTEEGTNLELLQQMAEANGVWVQKWAALNPGMQRMNLANRLRAYLRNHANATIALGGEGTGRFDVEFNPSKKALRAIRRAEGTQD